MAIANLNRDSYLINDDNENKVIVTNLGDIPGGRTLDMSAWNEDVLHAGHVIKYNSSTGEYAPLGVTSGAYAALGANEEYAGVLKASLLKSKPLAAILTVGQVNALACPYPITAAIVLGLPQIKFLGGPAFKAAAPASSGSGS